MGILIFFLTSAGKALVFSSLRRTMAFGLSFIFILLCWGSSYQYLFYLVLLTQMTAEFCQMSFLSMEIVIWFFFFAPLMLLFLLICFLLLRYSCLCRITSPLGHGESLFILCCGILFARMLLKFFCIDIHKWDWSVVFFFGVVFLLVFESVLSSFH